MEKYQAVFEKYKEIWTRLLDWIAANDRVKAQEKHYFADTD